MSTYTSTKFSLHDACGYVSGTVVRFCTSGFVDDVTFPIIECQLKVTHQIAAHILRPTQNQRSPA